MYVKGFLFNLFLLGLTSLGAQLPTTNLYKVEFVEKSGTIELKNPEMLSMFNAKGYNNQPCFLDPNTLYFTTNHKNSNYTDIAILDLRKNELSFFTRTDSISEYSPTLTPDKNHISVIKQVGEDQWLWQYPKDRSNTGKALITTTKDIGYHTWLDEDQLALFRVTNPVSLSVVNLMTNQLSDKLNDIGRCLKVDSDGNLVFVHKITSDFWYLKRYDLRTGKISVISEMDVEDFEILPSGTFIKGKGSKLFKMNEDDVNWEEFFDFESLGLSGITRIATSRNKLVFVAK